MRPDQTSRCGSRRGVQCCSAITTGTGYGSPENNTPIKFGELRTLMLELLHRQSDQAGVVVQCAVRHIPALAKATSRGWGQGGLALVFRTVRRDPRRPGTSNQRCSVSDFMRSRYNVCGTAMRHYRSLTCSEPTPKTLLHAGGDHVSNLMRPNPAGASVTSLVSPSSPRTSWPPSSRCCPAREPS